MVGLGQKNKGKVFLVGAGPGDPELITRKAISLISSCETLVFDYLANSEFRKYAAPGCEQINVGKSPGRHTVDQEQIC
jgi:siroheme synthase